MPLVGTQQSADAAWSVMRWCVEFDFDGILLFTGAGAVLDPWMGADRVDIGNGRDRMP